MREQRALPDFAGIHVMAFDLEQCVRLLVEKAGVLYRFLEQKMEVQV